MKMTRPVFSKMVDAFVALENIVRDDDGYFSFWPIYNDIRSIVNPTLLDVLASDSGVIVTPPDFSGGEDPVTTLEIGLDGRRTEFPIVTYLAVRADAGSFPRNVYGFYIQNPTSGDLVAYELFPEPIRFTTIGQAYLLPCPSMRFPASMVG